jgi:polar amino acid transport system substrate-binding protein
MRTHLKIFLLSILAVLFLVGICQAELFILGEESPPGEYLNARGEPAGVTINLVRELMHRQGITASIELLPWKRAYFMGTTEKNIILMETTRTAERENLFKWVGPILVVNRIVYARSDHNGQISSIEDIRNAGKICVLRGSSNESYLKSLGLSSIQSMTVPAQCLRMLLSDRVQLFYTSEIGMDGLLKGKKVDSKTVRPVFNLKKEYLYLAFSKDIDDARVQQWQLAFEEAKKDGTVERIYKGAYPDQTIREICVPGDPLAN